LNGGSSIAMRTAGSLHGAELSLRTNIFFFGYDDRIRGYFNKKIEAENKISASVELRLPILLPRY